ncbi:MAG: SIS domain-containing protein [Phycisphaerae bacterium]|nr:SIS domain-containing protein [Phycisphaerae bacterium]
MNETIEAQLAKHDVAVESVRDQQAAIHQMAETMIAALRRGNRIYLVGNGGSAADCQHIAAELISRLRPGKERQALPAVALTTDTSILTAIGNDYEFDLAFKRQVEGLVTTGDVLWALSTSGNSRNVLLAAEEAKARGASVIGFTGPTGGKLLHLADQCLRVNAETTDRIQEAHQLAYHLICYLIENEFVRNE